jgi:hypothetical protein
MIPISKFRMWEQGVYTLKHKIGVHFKRRNFFKNLMRKTLENRKTRSSERENLKAMRHEDESMRRLMIAEALVHAICEEAVASIMLVIKSLANLDDHKPDEEPDEEGDDVFFDFDEEVVDGADESIPLFEEESQTGGDQSAPLTDQFTLDTLDKGDQSSTLPEKYKPVVPSKMTQLQIFRGGLSYKSRQSQIITKAISTTNQKALLVPSHSERWDKGKREEFNNEDNSKKDTLNAMKKNSTGPFPREMIHKFTRSRTTIALRRSSKGPPLSEQINFVGVISFSNPAGSFLNEFADNKALVKVITSLFKRDNSREVKFKIYNCWDGEFPTKDQQQLMQVFVLLGNPEACQKPKKLKESFEIFRDDLREICFNGSKKVLAVASATSIISSFFERQHENVTNRCSDLNDDRVLITPIGIKMLVQYTKIPSVIEEQFALYFHSISHSKEQNCFAERSFNVILRMENSGTPILQQYRNILLSNSSVFLALEHRMNVGFSCRDGKYLESYFLGFFISNIESIHDVYRATQPVTASGAMSRRAIPRIVVGSEFGSDTNLNGILPKNSIMLDRMKRVIEKGADLIQVDVQLTADNVCICIQNTGLLDCTNIVEAEKLHKKFKLSDTDYALQELFLQDLKKYGSMHTANGDFYVSDLTLEEIRAIKKLPRQKFYRDQKHGLGCLPQYSSISEVDKTERTEELEYGIIPTLEEYLKNLESCIQIQGAVKPGLFINIVDAAVNGDMDRIARLVASLTICLQTVLVPTVVVSGCVCTIKHLRRGLRSDVCIIYRPHKDCSVEAYFQQAHSALPFAHGLCIHKEMLLQENSRESKISEDGKKLCVLLHTLGMYLVISGFQARPLSPFEKPQEQYWPLLSLWADMIVTENSSHATTSILKYSECFSTPLEGENSKVDAVRNPEPENENDENAASASGRLKPFNRKKQGKIISKASLRPSPPQFPKHSPANAIKTDSFHHRGSSLNPKFKSYDIDNPSETFMAHMQGPLRKHTYIDGIDRIAKRNENVRDFLKGTIDSKLSVKYSCTFSSGNVSGRDIEFKAVQDASLLFSGILSSSSKTNVIGPNASTYAISSLPENKIQEPLFKELGAREGIDLPPLIKMHIEAETLDNPARKLHQR